MIFVVVSAGAVLYCSVFVSMGILIIHAVLFFWALRWLARHLTPGWRIHTVRGCSDYNLPKEKTCGSLKGPRGRSLHSHVAY